MASRASCAQRWRLSGLLAVMLLLPTALQAKPVPVPSEAEFQSWLADFKRMAVARGLSKPAVDQALRGVAYIPRVIELDRRQPEFSLTFWQYLSRTISDKRIERGRELLKKHEKLLSRIQDEYGVQPRFLVAFWGLESNFGDFTGTFPLLGSLATLAYDPRRRKFFSEQLIAALEIIIAGDIPADSKSSWAGAMGNTQFIPTTYRAHAIDFDGDGKRDLWRSLPDVFASSAKFLAALGWQGERTWGREVRLPKNFDFSLAGLNKRKKIKEWERLGVRNVWGKALPSVDLDASLILPVGARGPAFLVYQNFRSTMLWNRSIFYALAVGHLSDRIAGRGPLVAKAPANDRPLSRAQIIEIQQKLARRGFDPGGADGIIGSGTRRAIRAFQATRNLPQDGFADAGLLDALRADGVPQ